MPSKEDMTNVRDAMARGRKDPVWWLNYMFGVDLWEKQKEIVEAVRDHKKVSVKSCHAIGKDFTSAHVVLWYLLCHPRCAVITTGPSDKQVKGILWSEIGRAVRGAKRDVGGQLLQSELHMMPNKQWSAIGFTAPEHEPDKFQGWHRPGGILCVVDEASGVSKNIIDEGVLPILTGGNAKLLMIGNPTDPISAFAESFKNDKTHKITVSALDTPNFTKFGITERDLATGDWEKKVNGAPMPREYLITPEDAADMYHHYGPTSPATQSRVFGMFPENSPDTLIPMAWIEKAYDREEKPGHPDEAVLAVDVARQGDDRSVCVRRSGNTIRTLWSHHGLWTTDTSAKVLRSSRETGTTEVIVDADGIGAGVADQLRLERGIQMTEMHGGEKADDPDEFFNSRSECYWRLREALNPENPDAISLDKADKDVMAELCDIKWKLDPKGRIQLEPKDMIKKRLGKSPDVADALAYAMLETGEALYWS